MVNVVQDIHFKLGDLLVSAAVSNYDGKHPELSVCITDKDGIVIQDICLVRTHVVSDVLQNTVDTKVDCLVWSDCDTEDYTDKFVIDVYDSGNQL